MSGIIIWSNINSFIEVMNTHFKMHKLLKYLFSFRLSKKAHICPKLLHFNLGLSHNKEMNSAINSILIYIENGYGRENDAIRAICV